MSLKLDRRCKQFTVDAFTSQPFRGNPAAVVLCNGNQSEEWMQNLAKENNLSETSFIAASSVEAGIHHYDIRWQVRIKLCIPISNDNSNEDY